MPTEIKICGLSDEEGIDAALDAGADYLGFVFFAASPRNVSLQRAAALAARARGRAAVVALTVDADDGGIAEIASTLRPDLLQLHGAETPERIAAVRSLTGRRVMKAVGVAQSGDLSGTAAFSAADRLLLDAKPPKGAARPGGNGAVFDWSILDAFAPARPWLLSGGLNPANVGQALATARPGGVDVSSGVETAPGRKEPELIRAFVDAVRAADASALRIAER